MGPFAPALYTGLKAGAALSSIPALFSGLRGRFAATRGAKTRRARARRAKAPKRRYVGLKNVAGYRNMTFNPPSFPRSTNASLTFSYLGPISTGTTQYTYGTENVFRLNDIFDPAVGAETLQPLYFDQYAAIWNRYRVMAATVEIRWTTPDTTHVTACAFKVGNSDDAVTIQGKTIRYVDAMQYADALVISPGGEHNFVHGPRTFYMNQIEGENWITKGDDYEAQVTASPATSPLLRIACAPVSSADDTSVYYRIWITYHVHFFDLKTPAEST